MLKQELYKVNKFSESIIRPQLEWDITKERARDKLTFVYCKYMKLKNYVKYHKESKKFSFKDFLNINKRKQ